MLLADPNGNKFCVLAIATRWPANGLSRRAERGG